jgi:hypothetical protein
MSKLGWLICGSVATIVVAGAPAWAQNKLDADTLKLYGGTYSTECGNSAAPRLRVVSDALMVEQGNKRMTGRNVQASYSFFGQSPPPDYQVALIGEVRNDLQLLFIVYRDKTSQYIKLDGDTKVQAALGKSLLGRKYASCDPVRKEVSSPPPSTAQSESITGPGDLLRDSRFKSAYFKALGPKVKESWLTELDGPAPPNKKVNIGGTEYTLASVCKNHDCGDNNMVLLYSGEKGIVYGKIFQQRRSTLIGAPPATVAAELDRLWVAQWRRR